jgi:hypothetical protein
LKSCPSVRSLSHAWLHSQASSSWCLWSDWLACTQAGQLQSVPWCLHSEACGCESLRSFSRACYLHGSSRSFYRNP